MYHFICVGWYNLYVIASGLITANSKQEPNLLFPNPELQILTEVSSWSYGFRASHGLYMPSVVLEADN